MKNNRLNDVWLYYLLGIDSIAYELGIGWTDGSGCVVLLSACSSADHVLKSSLAKLFRVMITINACESVCKIRFQYLGTIELLYKI